MKQSQGVSEPLIVQIGLGNQERQKLTRDEKMMTGKSVVRAPLIAPVAIGILGMIVGATLAAPISIDFDSNDTVQSGDPIHADGPSLPGQVGPWHKLTMKGSGQISTIDTGNGVFTFNTEQVAFTGYGNQEGGLSTPLRGNMFWMSSAATVTWTLTDLVPGGTYNIICYSTYNPAYGGYKLADFAIEGFDDGNVQPQDNGGGDDEEGDVDFFGVIADQTGTIKGTWSWIKSWAEFGGIQFELIAVPPPAGTVIVIR